MYCIGRCKAAEEGEQWDGIITVAPCKVCKFDLIILKVIYNHYVMIINSLSGVQCEYSYDNPQ